MRTEGETDMKRLTVALQFFELAYDCRIVLEAKVHSGLWYLRQGRKVTRKAVFNVEGKMPPLQIKFRIIYNFTHELSCRKHG